MTIADSVSAIREIYEAAAKRVHAGEAVRRSLKIGKDGMLQIVGVSAPIPPQGVHVIAFGKAALGMTLAAADILGDALAAGIAVTKDERAVTPDRVRVFRGAHPVPGEDSVAAGDAVLSFARSIPAGSVVLCLISGGGSALVEVPRDGVTLDTLQDVTRVLLRGGASILEINAVRSRLSAFKAGGLLAELAHTRVHNLIVSDVLGDNLQAIASGPTVQPADEGSPEDILNRLGIQIELPQRHDSVRHLDLHSAVIANVSVAIDAAAEKAAELGHQPFVLTRSIASEAREVGRLIAGVLTDSSRGLTSVSTGTCLICGGEMIVNLRGDGVGGRNTEAALSAAIALRGVDSCAVGFLATDGDDGASGAAGAIVHGATVPACDERRAIDALENNDSFSYLHERGATVITGPTGTNVNDLVIGIVS